MRVKQRDLVLQILSKLHLAREKARTSYHDTLMRAVTNFIMYVDVTRPRAFDADDLTKELPQDVMVGFLFQAIEEKASETGKVMVKDCRDLRLSSCI
jgi:hypothetical protein